MAPYSWNCINVIIILNKVSCSKWFLFSYSFCNQFINLVNFFIPMSNIRFQFWPYIKLMIIFCLVTPDFGRASYAYNNLIRTCISLNPQAIICRLNNWRKFFVKKDDFLLHVERYLNENGTEALEKLIASKVNIYIALSLCSHKKCLALEIENWS